MCCDSPTPAPAPDYTPIAEANAASAKLASESAAQDLAFRKQVYEENKPRQQQLADLAQQVADSQTSSMAKQTAMADENIDYWKKTYQPVERQTAMDAMGSRYLGAEDRKKLASIITGSHGMSPEDLTLELDRLAGLSGEGAAKEAQTRAGAQINNAFAQQARGLTRAGYNPNMVMSAAARLAQQQGLASVGAANNARTGVLDKNTALRTGVANFGRNMPNTALQSSALANQTGAGAVSNAGSGLASGLMYPQYVSGGVQNQMTAAGIQQQGALGLGQLMSGDYRSQLGYLGQAEAGQGAGTGQAIGAVAGIAAVAI